MTEEEKIYEAINNLKIENPCPMLLARLKGIKDEKYYCNSCEKEVIDFRDCSKEEIVKKVSNKNVCGIFYADQLPSQKFVRYSLVKKASFYSLILLSFFGLNVAPLNAQTKDKIVSKKITKAINPSLKKETRTRAKIQLNSSTEIKKIEQAEKPGKKTKKRRIRRKFLFRKRIMGCPAW